MMTIKKHDMKSIIKEIVIGKQTWSASNLNTIIFRNGDSIVEAQSEEEWHNFCKKSTPAYARLGYKKGKVNDNGLMYNGFAILDTRNLAPVGWRIPIKEDWDALIKYLKEDEGLKIKSTIEWADGGNGDGSTGFNALPNFSMNPDGVFRDTEDQGKYSNYFTGTKSKNILGSLCLHHIVLEDWLSDIKISPFALSYGAAVRLIKE